MTTTRTTRSATVIDLVDLERRVKALEHNRGASLRFARVTEVNEDGSARVELLDGPGLVSMPLRLLQRRTQKDKDQLFPEVGEHVACLFSGQGLEQGVILGAMYSSKNESAGQKTHMAYYEFEDGTVLSYDKEAHKLFADVKGELEAFVEKTAHVEVKQNTTLICEADVLVEAKGDITLDSAKRVILQALAGIYMYAPLIKLIRIKGAELPMRAEIDADLYLRGLFDHVGDQQHQGDTAQQGNQTTSGNVDVGSNVTAGGDIDAGGIITGHPVKGCEH